MTSAKTPRNNWHQAHVTYLQFLASYVYSFNSFNLSTSSASSCGIKTSPFLSRQGLRGIGSADHDTISFLSFTFSAINALPILSYPRLETYAPRTFQPLLPEPRLRTHIATSVIPTPEPLPADKLHTFLRSAITKPVTTNTQRRRRRLAELYIVQASQLALLAICGLLP
jgi:hypothetical protein